MKKSLIALALLGATAASAQAADVSVYGTVDAGVKYLRNADAAQEKLTNSFKLGSGIADGNKLGFKGSEAIGQHYHVGFQLETGFDLANGQLNDSKKLFDREARVFVNGVFGELSIGRMGALGSAKGTYDIFFANADAFDGGDQLGTFFNVSETLDNAVTYATPEVAGVKGYVQYSFAQDADQENKFDKNNRFWAVGATFNQDNFGLTAVVEQTIPSNAPEAKFTQKSTTVSLGGNVKLDNIAIFAGAQYAKNPHNLSIFNSDLDQKIYEDDQKSPFKHNVAFTLGSSIDLNNSNIMVAGYTGHAKINEKHIHGYGLSARYKYNLSTRTSLYAGVDGSTFKARHIDATKLASVYAGMTHNF